MPALILLLQQFFFITVNTRWVQFVGRKFVLKNTKYILNQLLIIYSKHCFYFGISFLFSFCYSLCHKNSVLRCSLQGLNISREKQKSRISNLSLLKPLSYNHKKKLFPLQYLQMHKLFGATKNHLLLKVWHFLLTFTSCIIDELFLLNIHNLRFLLFCLIYKSLKKKLWERNIITKIIN